MSSVVSLEDFRFYAQIKAYDVISSGGFRRHLSACRDSGDKWAIQMYNGQNAVQVKVREIFALVSQITGTNGMHVHQICKDVMSCAQPPVKVLTGYNKCALTGESVEHCIDLTRIGKKPKEVYVHPRFRHFFMLLWYCSKIEYVIRACTKQWIDNRDAKPSQDSYTQMCEEYAEENMATIDRLHALFVKGWNYTNNSLVIYRDKCAMCPALDASQENLNGDSIGGDGLKHGK